MLMDLSIYEPLTTAGQMLKPLDAQMIDVEVLPVQLSSILPGGFQACSIGLPSPGNLNYLPARLPIPSGSIRPYAHCVLSWGNFTVWEGQLVNPIWDGAVLTGLKMQGYGFSTGGLSRGIYASTDTTANTSAGCLSNVLAQQASWIIPGGPFQFQDPGTPHVSEDFNGLTPAEVVDLLDKEGDPTGVIWDISIWEGPTIWYLPRLTPALPDLVLPIAPGIQQSIDYTAMTAGVVMTYGASASRATTETIVDPTFSTRYGFTATTPLQGGNIGATNALVATRAYLNAHNAPLVTFTVTINARGSKTGILLEDGLPLPHGGVLPWWQTRPGQAWVEAGDVMLPVLRVEAHTDTGQVTYTIGTAFADAVDAYKYLMTLGVALERQINPISGGRSN